MRQNPVRRRLEGGGVAIGTMVTEFSTSGVARLAAHAGAEFVLYDLEHTGYDMGQMRSALAAARASDLVPFLRVPDGSYQHVARALDSGALGVMVPTVGGVEEARAVARASRFPPRGRRGFGVWRDEWHPDGVAATVAHIDEQVMTLLQIETMDGLEAVEEIAAVDGVDVLWIGHFDLSISLGVPGDFGSDVFVAAVDRVLAAGAASGKPVGIVCGSVAEGRAFLARGFRLLAYGVDVGLYEDALRAGVAGLRDGA